MDAMQLTTKGLVRLAATHSSIANNAERITSSGKKRLMMMT
jgi:hypothetical protein